MKRKKNGKIKQKRLLRRLVIQPKKHYTRYCGFMQAKTQQFFYADKKFF